MIVGHCIHHCNFVTQKYLWTTLLELRC
jgi:hypothetical protein